MLVIAAKTLKPVLRLRIGLIKKPLIEVSDILEAAVEFNHVEQGDRAVGIYVREFNAHPGGLIRPGILMSDDFERSVYVLALAAALKVYVQFSRCPDRQGFVCFQENAVHVDIPGLQIDLAAAVHFQNRLDRVIDSLEFSLVAPGNHNPGHSPRVSWGSSD